MVNVNKIYTLLDKMAPFSRQMGFDNAGFLVGRGQQEVSKILVALDITLPVIDEAVQAGAQLIVSHHPVIFHPIKSVTDGDLVGKKLQKLILNDISAICAHTNLDVAQGGVNDALAKALNLQKTGILETFGEFGPYGVKYGLGRCGKLETPMSPADFAEMVKNSLGCKALRCVLGEKPISQVAVAGGACGDMVQKAAYLGMDAFVTGDVKYDQFLDAAALDITFIDAGHFPTENVVCPVLREWLTLNFPEVEVVLSQVHEEVCRSI